MSEHTVKAFEDELEQLSAGIAQMGGLAEVQLSAAIDCIQKRDHGLAERTVAADERIDQLEAQIEDRAVRLLALRQPMALDLRETICAIKISTDLERIGDLAKNIAKRASVLTLEPTIQPMKGLIRMGRLSQNLLKEVLDAYTNRDAARALAVWKSDEEIDEMYNSLFRELLTYMMEDPRTITLGAHLLFVAKNIERIGDHATNIAETVYFLVEGSQLTVERPKSDTTSTTNVDYGDTAAGS